MYWLGPFLAFLIHCESGGGVLGNMYLWFWFCVAIKTILFVTFLLFSPLLPLYVGQPVQVFFFFFFFLGGIFPHSTPCPVIASHSYYLLFLETSSSLSYFLFFCHLCSADDLLVLMLQFRHAAVVTCISGMKISPPYCCCSVSIFLCKLSEF